MKVCILSHCFYPSKNRGGPTVSITNMVKSISSKFETSVITIAKDKGCESFYSEVSLGKNELFGSDVYYLEHNSIAEFGSKIKELKPDVIYVSSLFSYQYSLPAINYARKNKSVRLIIAPRGELMPEALNRKFFLKKAFLLVIKALLRKNVEFHATSYEEVLAITKQFKKAITWNIKNLATSVHPSELPNDKRCGELNIIMVGRVHPIKNIDYALNALSSVNGRVTLDIYGPLEDSDYAEKCKQIALRLPGNIIVNFKGAIEHDAINSLLAKYHILLSPTKSENFGHSIVESLMSGTPVIISDNTPWHNLKDNTAGFDIPLNAPSTYTQAIQRFIDMSNDEYESWCKGALDYITRQSSASEEQRKYEEMFLNKTE